MFYLIIYSDITQTKAIGVLKYNKMKDMIKATDNKVSYNTIRQKEAINKKYITRQSIYRVIKC